MYFLLPMRLILSFMFLGWKSTNNWPDWILLHQRTATDKLHGAEGWIQPNAGSLEAWNWRAVGLRWYSPNLLSSRGPRSQMMPKSEKNFLNSNKTQTHVVSQACVPITGLQRRFLLENKVLLLLKESGPHDGISIWSMSWSGFFGLLVIWISVQNRTVTFQFDMQLSLPLQLLFGFYQWVREIK